MICCIRNEKKYLNILESAEMIYGCPRLDIRSKKALSGSKNTALQTSAKQNKTSKSAESPRFFIIFCVFSYNFTGIPVSKDFFAAMPITTACKPSSMPTETGLSLTMQSTNSVISLTYACIYLSRKK